MIIAISVAIHQHHVEFVPNNIFDFLLHLGNSIWPPEFHSTTFQLYKISTSTFFNYVPISNCDSEMIWSDFPLFSFQTLYLLLRHACLSTVSIHQSISFSKKYSNARLQYSSAAHCNHVLSPRDFWVWCFGIVFHYIPQLVRFFLNRNLLS